MQRWTIKEPTSLTLDDVRDVKAFVVRGSVRVVGAPGPVRLEVSEMDGSPLFVRIGDDGRLEITHGELNGARMAISAMRRNHRMSAVVSLSVPPGCPVALSSATADITASGLSGDLTVFTSGSETALANLSGPVRLDQHDGRVGAVTISGPLSVKTLSADVTIADATGSVRVETGSGTVALDARPLPGANLQLASTAGTLRIGLPSLCDTHVRLECRGGVISSQFGEIAAIERDRVLVAETTAGTPLIELWATTGSGDIALLRRADDDG